MTTEKTCANIQVVQNVELVRKEVRNGMVEKKKASSREEAGKEKIPWWTWVPALIMSVTALMVNLLRIVW